MSWLKKLFGGSKSRRISDAEIDQSLADQGFAVQNKDGSMDMPVDCPKCKRRWMARFRGRSLPTRVHCPSRGWEGMMSMNW